MAIAATSVIPVIIAGPESPSANGPQGLMPDFSRK